MEIKENNIDISVPVRKRKFFMKQILVLILVFIAIAGSFAVFNANKVRTILSLKEIDGHPLYFMKYYGNYSYAKPEASGEVKCSAFLAFNKKGEPLFCRNLDYVLTGHPIAALFTAAHGKYSSISMTDLYYLGFDQNNPPGRSLIRDWGLLDAPKLPIDGMNEYGVALAMLSVPEAEAGEDSNKPTIDEVSCNRLILDNAKNIDEAIDIINKYNIKFNEGPIHYMLADSRGESAVVEFINNKVVVTRKQKAYQAVTNFIVAGDIGGKTGLDRYEIACSELDRRSGKLSEKEAMELLSKVSQGGTLWSIVYNLKTGDVEVAMDRRYDQIRKFKLDMAN